jgi:hypothetical protein
MYEIMGNLFIIRRINCLYAAVINFSKKRTAPRPLFIVITSHKDSRVQRIIIFHRRIPSVSLHNFYNVRVVGWVPFEESTGW